MDGLLQRLDGLRREWIFEDPVDGFGQAWIIQGVQPGQVGTGLRRQGPQHVDQQLCHDRSLQNRPAGGVIALFLDQRPEQPGNLRVSEKIDDQNLREMIEQPNGLAIADIQCSAAHHHLRWNDDEPVRAQPGVGAIRAFQSAVALEDKMQHGAGVTRGSSALRTWKRTRSFNH